MNLQSAKAALKKYYGYDNFRPMQEEIIQAIYDKKDAMVLMPTGGGKSVCFQIPAVTMEGLCIVVSPLISLMKDQVESLKANGIEAAFLNSSISATAQRQIEDDVYHNKLKLLYVSPEKMVSQSFMPLLQQAKVNLFAIDEAHCISAWGHDFRPEYTEMQFIKRSFPDVPIVALTATADKLTRKDILSQLGMQNPEVFIASFDRPNLSLTVAPGQKRLEQILEFVNKRPNQAGIIYCLSRKNCENVSAKLAKKGLNTAYYHAGLSSSERNNVQENFINDNIDIVCATVAFGMGIDKSNVRWVIHYNLPKNMESYYQEIGRAGRDGAQSDTLLFYSFQDVRVLRDILGDNDGSAENTDIKLSKLERMQEYAEALICRRKILLAYFGEDLSDGCGNCDVCKNPPQYFDGTIIAQKALSAIARVRESVGQGLLIDVLRGSRRREIFQYGFDKLKTYGIGAGNSFRDWQYFIQQLINLGFIEIAYDQQNALRLTGAAKEVLFEKREVQLVKMVSIKERKEQQAKKIKKKTKAERVRDELFELLRQLRKEIAQKKGVPPYIIFSDATLEEMSAARPTDDVAFLRISGVGEKKLELYGALFIAAIKNYIVKKSIAGENLKGATNLVTLELYKQGLNPEQIAEKRSLSEVTIYSHLAQLYEKGEVIDLGKFVTKAEVKRVLDVLQELPEPYTLKPIFDKLNEEVSYAKIKMAMAYYNRQMAEQ